MVGAVQAALAFVAFTIAGIPVLTAFIAALALTAQYAVISHSMAIPAERLRGLVLKLTLHVVLIALITAFVVTPEQRHTAWETVVEAKWQTLLCWGLAYLLALNLLLQRLP
ncbi:hypothetical protein [Grimontia sedimenti]|uniref:hypothetical protein n=1 Tax=Grimontia sedimenti TaxID=2711294 RepID=UPI001F2A6401|nr:hypothetical protein [Grimontia sedimenti]